MTTAYTVIRSGGSSLPYATVSADTKWNASTSRYQWLYDTHTGKLKRFINGTRVGGTTHTSTVFYPSMFIMPGRPVPVPLVPSVRTGGKQKTLRRRHAGRYDTHMDDRHVDPYVLQAKKEGETPSTPEGKASDLERLRQVMQTTLADAQRAGLPVKGFRLVPDMQHYNTVIGTFSLAVDPIDDGKLLQPADTGGSAQTSPCREYVEKLKPSTTNSGYRRDPSSPLCRSIDERQKSTQIHLHLGHIFCLYPKRWLNDRAIDAYIHEVARRSPLRGRVMIHSARQDADLELLAQTPKCYSDALCPTYREYHWTFTYVDFQSGDIWHLNSDVHDMRIPYAQMESFRRLFPNFKLHIIPCFKQCDDSSCGVAVCYWAWAFLINRKRLLDINCDNIVGFRELMLRQMIVSFLLH